MCFMEQTMINSEQAKNVTTAAEGQIHPQHWRLYIDIVAIGSTMFVNISGMAPHMSGDIIPVKCLQTVQALQ